MPAYLITGRTGTGKSTICKLLTERGFTAFDGDEVPGLAYWIDVKTARPTKVDYTKPIDTTKVDWYWHEDVLRELLQQHAAGTLFLCGSAGNQLPLHRLFDRVFVLTLPPHQQLARIMGRERGYGKYPEMHAAIIEETTAFNAAAREKGDTLVDAMPPANQVAAGILQEIGRTQ